MLTAVRCEWVEYGEGDGGERGERVGESEVRGSS